MALGCNATTDGSSRGYAGYIFAQHFDGERKVLHLPTTPDPITRCSNEELPGVEYPWREIQLDPGLHRSVAELIEDPEALEHYEADTVASKGENRRVCLERPGQPDFCYSPDLSVSRSQPIFIWIFWLGPEVTLSPQSSELVDAWRAAHEECWTKGAPAPPGYGISN